MTKIRVKNEHLNFTYQRVSLHMKYESMKTIRIDERIAQESQLTFERFQYISRLVVGTTN